MVVTCHLQFNPVQTCAQYRAILYNTVQYCTILYNKKIYCTVLYTYCTVLHSVQYLYILLKQYYYVQYF